MQQLKTLGFTARLEAHFAPHAACGHLPGRVVAEHTHLYRVLTEDGERLAGVSGKLRHEARSREAFPAVGDWVALAPEPEGRGVIHAVLPRASKFSRQAPGGGEQIVATNVQTVFLVAGLDQDFNLRRLERYLALAWESGAQPVVVLNKADLAADLEEQIAQARAIAPGVPIHAVSASDGLGLEQLAPHLAPGQTVALLGSSGVGKSSLLNRLAGEERQATGASREADGRGRHTTTHRELLVLPGGALMIDTPGMRELGMWDADEGLETAFADVAALASTCRFSDCKHEREPGCAVIAAVESGALGQARLGSYLKLQRELAHQARKSDQQLMAEERARWKRISVEAKKHIKAKRQ